MLPPVPNAEHHNKALWPVVSAEREGVYAVMCGCEHIGSDGNSVADAITIWNAEASASHKG